MQDEINRCLGCMNNPCHNGCPLNNDIPNLINLIVKNDSKKAIVLSVVYGSLFTMICDLLSRTLSNSEIPVGIITGFLGAIIFIIVLFVRRIKHAK